MMRHVRDRAERIFYVMQSLGPRAFLHLLGSMLFSVNHYYLVGLNLAAPLKHPLVINPKGSITPVTAEDMEQIARSLPTLDPEDRRELLSRLFFYKSGFSNCYLMRQADDVAYLQWMISAAENPVIEQSFSAKYYPLKVKQVMIENAFTFPRYRGRGYFLAGTMQLLELAKKSGYTAAISYIRKDRISPLNEFTQMGFKVIKMVTEYKLLGKAWRTL